MEGVKSGEAQSTGINEKVIINTKGMDRNSKKVSVLPTYPCYVSSEPFLVVLGFLLQPAHTKPPEMERKHTLPSVPSPLSWLQTLLQILHYSYYSYISGVIRLFRRFVAILLNFN